MAICEGCPHREELACTFPEAVKLDQERRKAVMVDFGGKDKARSGGYVLYLSPPTDCSGKRDLKKNFPDR
jgi:hypothetical protein